MLQASVTSSPAAASLVPVAQAGLSDPRRAERSHDSVGGSAIRAVGLCKRYGDTTALDQLDLTVNQGEVYGYLGPNGSGKTTTIRLLLGLHRPSSTGSVVSSRRPPLQGQGAQAERGDR